LEHYSIYWEWMSSSQLTSLFFQRDRYTTKQHKMRIWYGIFVGCIYVICVYIS
jgi:hypothetical protein